MAAAVAVLAASAAASAQAADWLPEQPLAAPGFTPEISVGPDGAAAVLSTTGGGDLVAHFRSPGGSAFGAPQTLLNSSVLGTYDVAVGSGGYAVAVWDDNGTVSASLRDPATGTWGAPDPVSINPAAGVRAAMDAAGNAYVVWAETAATTGIYFATAPPGGAFGAPTLVSQAGFNAQNQAIAASPTGRVVVGWTRTATSNELYTRIRPPSGAFGPTDAVTPNSASADNPDVAIDDAGNALVAFEYTSGGFLRAAAATRPAGGSWTPSPNAAVQFLSDAGEHVGQQVEAEIASGGTGVVAWRNPGGTDVIEAATSAPGGSFGGRQVLSDPSLGGATPRLASNGGPVVLAWIQSTSGIATVGGRQWDGGWNGMTLVQSSVPPQDITLGADAQGNAMTAYAEPAGDARTAVYDGAAPTLTGFSAPVSGAVGELLGFAVDAPTDRWSSASASWDFGDGTVQPGTTASHAFGSAGTFNGRLTVSDTAGNAVTRDFAVTAQAPAVAPPPPPPGDQPLPPPVLAKLVNATPVSGTVRVRLPGSRVFVPLAEARQIPMGSIVDARRGRVRITGTDGRKTFSADFYEGMFRITQGKRLGSVINIILFGGSFRGCPRAPKAQLSALSKKRSVRHLWGDGRGKFRTVGRFSSATLRGTKWLTDDRCNGTRTRVAKGAVTVRDFVRRRNVVVRAPKSYFARPARRRR